MTGIVTFWISLAVSLVLGWMYFRDLGDVTEMVMKVMRENAIRMIRHEFRFVAAGLLAAVIMSVAYFAWDGGPRWAFVSAAFLVLVFYGFPFFWVHVGLRNQADSARYYPIDIAAKYINPSSPVIVIENNGEARAHSDDQLLQPHLAGDKEGLGGENVIMTYCGMANLGQGYIPEIGEEGVELCVLAQHGNNLIMRDQNSREPIQQIYGFRERDGSSGPRMRAWPTFRMSFYGFQKAYPEGEVFLKLPSKNPVVRFLDFVTGIALSFGIALQHRHAEPVMDNMSHSDDRLPKKTYVWGVDIGDDAVCFTLEFVIENGFLVNTEVGGQRMVVSWYPVYQSFGAWYNTGVEPVSEIDFFGKSDQGLLQRVSELKSGLFFHVWAEFFPHTDINRVSGDEA